MPPFGHHAAPCPQPDGSGQGRHIAPKKARHLSLKVTASAVSAPAGEVARWSPTTSREKLARIRVRIGRARVRPLFPLEIGSRTRPPVDRGSAEEQGAGCRRARPGTPVDRRMARVEARRARGRDAGAHRGLRRHRQLRDRRPGRPRRLDRLARPAALRLRRLLRRPPRRPRERPLADRARRPGREGDPPLPRGHADPRDRLRDRGGRGRPRRRHGPPRRRRRPGPGASGACAAGSRSAWSWSCASSTASSCPGPGGSRTAA